MLDNRFETGGDKMALVEINEEQQKILDKYEFDKLVEQRSRFSLEIQKLEDVRSFVRKEEEDFREICERGILKRLITIHEIDEALTVSRKKLGIETPTIHTEL